MSNVDNSLLFSVPVHASIVAARPSRHREDGNGAGMEEGAEGGEEGRLPHSIPLANEGPNPSLPPRFWPDQQRERATGADNNESGRVGNNPSDDQLGKIVEMPTGSSPRKRADGKGWIHSPDSLEMHQVGVGINFQLFLFYFFFRSFNLT